MSTSFRPTKRLAIIATLIAILISAQPVRSDDKLEALWKDYQSYGLPAPSADAELGLLPGPEVRTNNGVREQDTYLVLLIKRADKKGLPVYWISCEEGPRWRSITIQPILPAKVNLHETKALAVEDFGVTREVFTTYPDLALAIQCHARGWDDIADALLERSRRRDAKSSHFASPKPRPRDDGDALAQLAWNYYCSRFTSDKGDRKPIVAQLKKLIASPHRLDTKANRNIIADMEQTLIPVKTTAGSPEAALEGLLDLKADWGSWLGTGWDDMRNDADQNEHYKKLRDLGVAAVPLLVQHLSDFRLTRQLQVTRLKDYTWNLRVSDVVAQLLNGMVDKPFAYDFLEREGRGIRLDEANVAAWWKETGQESELGYLLKHLDRTDGGRAEGNPIVLNILGSRYPDELAKAFEERLKTNNLDWNWFDAIAAGKSTAAVKARLFLAAAKSTDEQLQLNALSDLADMKNPEAAKLIVAALDRQPKTPKDGYWNSRIGRYAGIAYQFEDEEVWKAVERTAKRVDVGQRMEMLDGFSHCSCRTFGKNARQFLKSMLDDTEVRDLSGNNRFGGSHAGFFFEKLAVRDFAAEKLAEVLKMNISPEPSWTESDWAKLREKVTAKLSEVEKSPPKEKKP